jgi:hypothetical protein
MEFRITALFFSLLAPMNVAAGCYVIGNLEGQSTRQGFEFRISEDGLSEEKFIVELNGSKSKVTPHDMDCDQVGGFTLLCVDAAEDGKSIVETWSVFPEEQKLVHTKSINGLGAFNGGNLFVGEIIGRCD